MSWVNKNSSALIEAMIGIATTVVVFYLSARLDLLGEIYSVCRANGAFVLEEVLTTVVFAALYLLFFSLRRWREATVFRLGLESHQTLLLQKIDEVSTLEGLLPICSSCKSVRDKAGVWHSIDAYMSHHCHTEFTHGLCPECLRRDFPELADAILSTCEQDLIR